MSDNRRDFLKKSGLLGLAGLAGAVFGENRMDRVEEFAQHLEGSSMYSLPKLPYGYDALEPFIDKQTMEIHHTKHHQAYVDKLNKALESYKGDTGMDALLKTASKLEPAIRNNAGGHYNHSLFWELLKPNPEGKPNEPSDKVGEAIKKNFGTVENLKAQFTEKATKIFGSGWCWLILDANGTLKITTTPNQDNPVMDVAADRGKPILALDVWEHAYYLKYQNVRGTYVQNWWNLVNWKRVEELYDAK